MPGRKKSCRWLFAVTGAVLSWVLVAPPAAAQNAASGTNGNKCVTSRDLASVVVDDGEFAGTQFRVTTDKKGRAFFNDSRAEGDWINLAAIPYAPSCVVDAALGYTESGATPPAKPNSLYVDLLAANGTVYQAVCTISADDQFRAYNIASFCGDRFVPVPGTPVG
ncbi:hypothetical protein [Streptomyces sp. NPDC001340]